MIKDYDFNDRMMEKTSHFMFIILFLGNIWHLIYAPEKVVGYVKHPYPTEMNLRGRYDKYKVLKIYLRMKSIS